MAFIAQCLTQSVTPRPKRIITQCEIQNMLQPHLTSFSKSMYVFNNNIFSGYQVQNIKCKNSFFFSFQFLVFFYRGPANYQLFCVSLTRVRSTIKQFKKKSDHQKIMKIAKNSPKWQQQKNAKMKKKKKKVRPTSNYFMIF